MTLLSKDINMELNVNEVKIIVCGLSSLFLKYRELL
jgi:hypothetical protein